MIESTPASDADEHELSRQNQRQAVKRKIASLQVREEKVRALREQIAAVNAETDAADDEHRRRCEPLQNELGEIEQRHIEALTAKRKQDATDAQRQRELLALITKANSELELTAEANKRTIAGIERQIRELQPPPGSESDNVTTCENRLAGELARPEQQARMFALTQRLRAANMWAKSAGEQIEKCREVLDQPHKYANRSVAYARTSFERWTAVVADANELAAEARAESERLRRQCLEA